MKPWYVSDGSAHLKKIETSSSDGGTVGEGGFFLRMEHQRNVKNYTKGSNVTNHAWQNNHSIDLDNDCVITEGNYRVRKT